MKCIICDADSGIASLHYFCIHHSHKEREEYIEKYEYFEDYNVDYNEFKHAIHQRLDHVRPITMIEVLNENENKEETQSVFHYILNGETLFTLNATEFNYKSGKTLDTEGDEIMVYIPPGSDYVYFIVPGELEILRQESISKIIRDNCQVLDINPNELSSVLKKKYHKAALKNHPDKGGDEIEFKKVQEAYEILKHRESPETLFKGKCELISFNPKVLIQLVMCPYEIDFDGLVLEHEILKHGTLYYFSPLKKRFSPNIFYRTFFAPYFVERNIQKWYNNLPNEFKLSSTSNDKILFGKHSVSRYNKENIKSIFDRCVSVSGCMFRYYGNKELWDHMKSLFQRLGLSITPVPGDICKVRLDTQELFNQLAIESFRNPLTKESVSNVLQTMCD